MPAKKEKGEMTTKSTKLFPGFRLVVIPAFVNSGTPPQQSYGTEEPTWSNLQSREVPHRHKHQWHVYQGGTWRTTRILH